MDTSQQEGRQTKNELDWRNNKRTLGTHQKNDDRYKFTAFDENNDEIINKIKEYTYTA